MVTGGLIALKMARVLAGDAELWAVEVLMIDYVCPLGPRDRLDPGTETGAGVRTVEQKTRIGWWAVREETKRAILRFPMANPNLHTAAVDQT